MVPKLVLVLLIAPAGAMRLPDNVAGDVPSAGRSDDAGCEAPELLEAKFGGGRTPDELRLIARAYVNQARQSREGRERRRACEQAGERYRALIKMLEEAGGRHGDRPLHPSAHVDLAAAHVEYAGLLMGLQAAAELDLFELTDGRLGDRSKLRQWLHAAREQYQHADQILTPLYDALGEREDEFLAAGLYDQIVHLKLDIIFNRAWAEYHLALISPADETSAATFSPADAPERVASLGAAERGFQTLLDSRLTVGRRDAGRDESTAGTETGRYIRRTPPGTQAGRATPMLTRAYLGLAVTRREQGRYELAEHAFLTAMRAEPAPALAAQLRYELARCHLRSGKFEEARAVLKPLVEKDPENLPPEELAVRFYVNLAHLWDANSYLLEAESLRQEPAGSTARTALMQRVQRCREIGLTRLSRLAARGGAWPSVVQLYIAAHVDPADDPARLSLTELLYTARQLADAQQYADAVRRLELALTRGEFQKDPGERTRDETRIGGDVLMELGKCYYHLHQLVPAAETFGRLAREYRSHELAPQAATFACQLWAQIAQKSERKEDYGRLAETLLNLLQSFPDHPERSEVAWLLPVALQAAGRYAEAADEFAKVPEASAHWEEAQYRRAACIRLAAEVGVGGAPEAAAALLRYAEQAHERAGAAPPARAAQIRDWAAEARVGAAELLLSPGVERFEEALGAVAEFEERHESNDRIGRVLGVRIRAYGGLRRFGEAARILDRYLQAVSAEQGGAVLPLLTRGMEEEVARLQEAGQHQAAHKLAAESIEAFTQLEQWLRRDPGRASAVAAARFGLADMLRVAGRLDEARQFAEELLRQSPQNGNYQRLHAQILTAALPVDPSPEQLRAAQDAWGRLLADPTIRQRAPERYWEARYHWLALLLTADTGGDCHRSRESQAARVDQAITQEEVWFPDLGGPPWRDRLLALREQARALSGRPTSAPTSPPSVAEDSGN